MDTLFPLLSPSDLVLAAMIAVLAGFVKGVVGFAMPLVFVSGLTTFMSAELALAGLILPTLLANVQQSLRQGVQAAVRSTVDFRIFLGVGCVSLLASAQLIRFFSDHIMMGVIGIPVTFFAAVQLAGAQFSLRKPNTTLEMIAGGVAGGLGGVSGIWGPPTVAYLTALNTPKHDQMRVQGVIYGLGAVALLVAHVISGVVRAETIAFSVAMIPPAFVGMQVGMLLMDRIDQQVFRRATLFVLLIAGLNLVRRALMG